MRKYIAFICVLLFVWACYDSRKAFEDAGNKAGTGGHAGTAGKGNAGGHAGSSDHEGTGDAGGRAGSSGRIGTGDAGGQSGSSGFGGTGGELVSGGAGGSGGLGGAGGTEGSAGTIGIGGTGESGGTGGTGGTSDSGGISSNTYKINGDGTVTDETTGLMWTRCAAGLSGNDCSEGSASTYTWQEAMDYCDGLNFAGHDDWRLPAINELVSLVDYTVDYRKFLPAINLTAFPATFSYFWSSSSSAHYVTFAWAVDFGLGGVYDFDESLTYYVRCVRGGPLVIGSFEPSVVSGDPIVKDLATGLIWQGCPAGMSGESCNRGSETTFDRQNAFDYCGNLTWASYGDWRLPEIHELISIVDYKKYDPAINETAFPATPSDTFWSSSSPVYNSSQAWSVDFSYGFVSSTGESLTFYVRCVRGGPLVGTLDI
jgi:hypothetical protein